MYEILAQAATVATNAISADGLPTWEGAVNAAFKYFGVPGALFAMFLYALQKRWIVMGREKDDVVKQLDDYREESDKRMDEYRKESEKRMGEYKTERDEYKAERDKWMIKTIESFGDLSKAVNTIEMLGRKEGAK